MTTVEPKPGKPVNKSHSSGAGEVRPAGFDPVLNEALAIALAAPENIVSDVVSWHGHISFAQALVAIARPRLVVELGVHKGDSYRALVDAMARYGVKGRAFGIDNWRGDEHAGNYQGDVILEEVTTRNEPFAEFSTLLRKTFDEALDDFGDGTIDLLHIDGFHTYEAVRHDFESWRPKLSAKAIVLFHDTAVRHGSFGVYRFWDEVSKGRLSHAFAHSNGLGVLCVGDGIDPKTRRLMGLLEETPWEGVAPAKLFETVGEAYAGRIAANVFRRLYKAKDSEVQALQSASIAEIERLNAEIVAIRKEGQAALDHAAAESAEVHRQLADAIGRADGFKSAPMAGIERLTIEMGALKGETLQALERIADEIVSIRCESQAALERVAAEAIAARQEARATSEALALEMREAHTAVMGEIGQVYEKQQALAAQIAAAERSRHTSLKERARRAGGAAKRTGFRVVKAGGRTAINLLPISPQAKTRLKFRLIARHGHLIGLNVGRRSYDATNSAQVALHEISGRYLDITRAATGAPVQVPSKRVSIIIPVYNQLGYTLRCLASIKRNTDDVEHEIVIVDDCSSDETPIELSQRDDIIFVRNPRNIGFIGSCNAGLARASMDYVLYLNNDTEVGPGWLSALVNTFELNEHVGMVGSKLIYPDGRLQEAGGIIWDDFSGWNWGRMQDPDDPRFNYVRKADYCSGASLMLPRELAKALGGFDPEFTPAYGEDSDLAFKIRSLGLSVLYQPLSQVIHYEGISSGTDLTQGVKAYQVVNAKKLAERWAPVLPHHSRNGENPDIAADGGHVGRVLVIDQITPEPDRDAGSITALELMRALRDLGYKVTFIPCSNFTHIPDYSDTLTALGIESVHYPWTKSVREHLERFGQHYDAAVIFRFNSATDHLDTVRELAPQAKVIYHTSDLHFLREERARQVDNPGIPERGHAFKKTKKAELGIVGKSDVTVLHSQYEKELLATLAPGKPVVVFPWIYQPRGAGKPASERRDLVFLGGYRHYPNVDAVTHFAQNVLPLLLPKNPDIVFHAIGSNPPPEMADLASANLRIAGFVEDVSPVLWGARMMVAPLRYGAGLKGKIVTAMAHGLPVITTTIGAEGMGLTDGVDVIVADEPAEMAAAIERLNSDDTLWNSLSKAGLDYVARTTSREVGYGIVQSILEKIGLPTVARIGDAGEGDQYRAAFGSPGALFDPAALLAAAGDTASSGVFVVPPVFARTKFDGWEVTTVDEATRRPAERVVAIVDGTSDAELGRLASNLPRMVAGGGSATVVFAPPRLVLQGGTYKVTRPFTDQSAAVAVPVRPPHLQHAARLAVLGGTLGWRADATILGFPSLIMADWRP